jgi:ABC-2 type transport system permease protein
MRKENRAWWGTRRWWINAILWTGLLCGLMAILLFGPNNELQEASADEIAAVGGELAFVMEIGLNIFFQFGVAATAIGIIVLTQDAVIAEKQNGLAEWLLSKPLERRAYVLAKMTANAVPMLLWLIGLPAAVAYGLLSLRMGAAFPGLPFLSGVGIMTAHTFFYLTLTLMLGTFFNNRGPILGIALGSVLGGGMIGSFIKPLLIITPWMLPKVATLTASGQTLPPEVGIIPIVATAFWSVVFVTVALIRFEKMEF